MQGGYVYAYGLKSLLDSAGEYFVDHKTATLSFIPPEGASTTGTYSISRLESAVVAKGVTNVTLENLEIRYARGGGVVVTDSTGFRIRYLVCNTCRRLIDQI